VVVDALLGRVGGGARFIRGLSSNVVDTLPKNPAGSRV